MGIDRDVTLQLLLEPLVKEYGWAALLGGLWGCARNCTFDARAAFPAATPELDKEALAEQVIAERIFTALSAANVAFNKALNPPIRNKYPLRKIFGKTFRLKREIQTTYWPRTNKIHPDEVPFTFRVGDRVTVATVQYSTGYENPSQSQYQKKQFCDIWIVPEGEATDSRASVPRVKVELEDLEPIKTKKGKRPL